MRHMVKFSAASSSVIENFFIRKAAKLRAGSKGSESRLLRERLINAFNYIETCFAKSDGNFNRQSLFALRAKIDQTPLSPKS